MRATACRCLFSPLSASGVGQGSGAVVFFLIGQHGGLFDRVANRFCDVIAGAPVAHIARATVVCVRRLAAVVPSGLCDLGAPLALRADRMFN